MSWNARNIASLFWWRSALGFVGLVSDDASLGCRVVDSFLAMFFEVERFSPSITASIGFTDAVSEFVFAFSGLSIARVDGAVVLVVAVDCSLLADIS